MLLEENIYSFVHELHHDWYFTGHFISIRYTFEDFKTAIKFIDELAVECEKIQHHPFIELDYNQLCLFLRTNDVDAVTDKDTALAHFIDELLKSYTV